MILTEDIKSIRERMPEPTRFEYTHYRAVVKEHKRGLGMFYDSPVRLIQERTKRITFTKTLVIVDDTSFYCWKCDLDGQLYI